MNWLWRLGAPAVRWLLSLGFRIRVTGADGVPRSGPIILACNHVSVLDGPALAAVTGSRCRRATRFLIAAEMWRGPIGWILRTARQIPIRRGEGDAGALQAAVAAVDRGGCAGIFPEGRVSVDATGQLERLRSGIARVAMPTGAPVIPVGIWGTQEVWSRGRLHLRALLRRPTLALVYGDPVLPAGDLQERSEVDAFLARVAAAMGTQVEAAIAIADGAA